MNLFNIYRYFQTNLAQITSFWDFNKNLKITSNKENFWDNSHMREKIGSLIIETIFCKNNIYDNFVTSSNVLKHLDIIERIGKLND